MLTTAHHDLYCNMVQAMRYLRHLETIGCHATSAHCDGRRVTITIAEPDPKILAGWSWSYVAPAAHLQQAPIVCRMQSDDLVVEWTASRQHRHPAPARVARALGRAAA